MTIDQAMMAALVALSSVVVFLYKRSEDRAEARYTELKSRVDDCEEDRTKLWDEIRKLMAGPRTDP